MFLLLYILWILFTYSLEWQELVCGFAVSLIVMYMIGNYTEFKVVDTFFDPFKMAGFFVYLIVFLLIEIRSHLSVAWSVVTGRINPAIVKVVPEFESEFGRAFFANSITLTPGTVSVSIGKNLYVHCLDYRRGDKIGSSFIKYGRRVVD